MGRGHVSSRPPRASAPTPAARPHRLLVHLAPARVRPATVVRRGCVPSRRRTCRNGPARATTPGRIAGRERTGSGRPTSPARRPRHGARARQQSRVSSTSGRGSRAATRAPTQCHRPAPPCRVGVRRVRVPCRFGRDLRMERYRRDADQSRRAAGREGRSSTVSPKTPARTGHLTVAWHLCDHADGRTSERSSEREIAGLPVLSEHESPYRHDDHPTRNRNAQRILRETPQAAG